MSEPMTADGPAAPGVTKVVVAGRRGGKTDALVKAIADECERRGLPVEIATAPAADAAPLPEGDGLTPGSVAWRREREGAWTPPAAEDAAGVDALRRDLEFERGRCASLAAVADRLAARAEAAEAEVHHMEQAWRDAVSDGDHWRKQVADLRALLAGSGEQPALDPEAACATCSKPRREHRSGYSAHRCMFRPALVAPDSAGLRGRVAQAVDENLRPYMVDPSKRSDAVDPITDAVLAVMGQGVSNCRCNVGVQECPDHPGRLLTKDEKIAFRKEWDARVRGGP